MWFTSLILDHLLMEYWPLNFPSWLPHWLKVLSLTTALQSYLDHPSYHRAHFNPSVHRVCYNWQWVFMLVFSCCATRSMTASMLTAGTSSLLVSLAESRQATNRRWGKGQSHSNTRRANVSDTPFPFWCPMYSDIQEIGKRYLISCFFGLHQ